MKTGKTQIIGQRFAAARHWLDMVYDQQHADNLLCLAIFTPPACSLADLLSQSVGNAWHLFRHNLDIEIFKNVMTAFFQQEKRPRTQQCLAVDQVEQTI